jgi:very-short-patch-repair endonuclease
MDITSIAERQFGLITHEQAVESGLSRFVVRELTRSGRWWLVHRHVYAIAGSPRSWEQVALAAVFASGGRAVLSHGSASHLYGMRSGELEDGVELTSERSRRVRMPGVISHRSLLLFDEDRCQLGPFPITSAARLVVDLSGRLSAAALGRVTDDLMRRRKLDLVDLKRCVGRLPFAPGRAPSKVHDVLRARWSGYDPGDSDLETRVLRALARAGLPIPHQQVRVEIRGRRYYIDLAYTDVLLAVEVDSWLYHRSRSRFDGDRARRNDLTLLGWTVLQVTDGMSDDEIVATVASALTVLGRGRAV